MFDIQATCGGFGFFLLFFNERGQRGCLKCGNEAKTGSCAYPAAGNVC